MEAKDFVVSLIGAGLTQSVIAERTGIPQPTISKIARGDVDDVMSRNYRKLQALFDETPAAIAHFDASKNASGPCDQSAASVSAQGA